MSHFGIKTGVARIFKSYGPCNDYSEGSSQDDLLSFPKSN